MQSGTVTQCRPRITDVQLGFRLLRDPRVGRSHKVAAALAGALIATTVVALQIGLVALAGGMLGVPATAPSGAICVLLPALAAVVGAGLSLIRLAPRVTVSMVHVERYRVIPLRGISEPPAV